jgi:hypothetical protein
LKVDTTKDKNDPLHTHDEHVDPEQIETGHVCKNGWYELRPKGKVPEKRSHHSSVIYDGCLYVYGGEDVNISPTDSDSREGKFERLWRLNLDEFIEIGEKGEEENKDLEGSVKDDESVKENDKLQWHSISTSGSKPGALSHHRGLVIGDDMYVFGGMLSNGENNQVLYCLNLKSFEWRVLHLESDNACPGRDDHSMAVSETAFYIFGGFVKDKRMNDLYEFCCDTKKWTCLSEYQEVDEFSPEEKRCKYPVPR